MKGLLIKDWRLALQQKRFFVMILIISFFLNFNLNGNFSTGYLTFVGAMFVMSTISYDEYDNGYLFLMSLPVSRQTYVKEKYLFGFLLGMAAWLLAAVFFVVYQLAVTADFTMGDTFLIILIYIPIFIIVIDVLMPFQLKYGGEKGRIVMFAFIGGMLALGYLFVLLIKMLGVDLSQNLYAVSYVDVVFGEIAFFLLAAVVTGISMAVSIRIMKKKEF